MKSSLIQLPAKYLMGKGIDKHFPFLVTAYKKVYLLLQEEGNASTDIALGSKLFVSKKDAGLGLMLRMKNAFEPLQTKLFISEVRKGAVVVDIGANVGYYTVLAGKLVGGKGRVFAFEPDSGNYKLLAKNVATNALGNAEVFKAAAGEMNGKANFYSDKANPGESSLTGKGKPQAVKVVKLDTFLGRKRITKIDLIKIDVEGAEVSVLKGAERILAKQRKTKLFVEVNPRALQTSGMSTGDLLIVVRELGFKPALIINEHAEKIAKYSDQALWANLKTASYVTVFAQK